MILDEARSGLLDELQRYPNCVILGESGSAKRSPCGKRERVNMRKRECERETTLTMSLMCVILGRERIRKSVSSMSSSGPSCVIFWGVVGVLVEGECDNESERVREEWSA